MTTKISISNLQADAVQLLDAIATTANTAASVATLTYESANAASNLASSVTASVTIYATPDLLPLSGVSVGSQALVTSTNRLYIWSGTGWYSIALINTNPTITTEGDASYELNSDGTPTVITLAANDPEGVPITWSHTVTSGSLEDTTVTNVDNVFTVTPGQTEATFDLTFTASDGINIDTSTSSFTLSFAPPAGQQEYTSPGTYSWTAPDGITSVSVVCVGGGGSGGTHGTGGGGGGLGWKNNITVIPGQSYTVVVGAGGPGSYDALSNGIAGEQSYFINPSTVRGAGGSGGLLRGPGVAPGYQIAGGAGGTYTGDGGGNGGAGGTCFGSDWSSFPLVSGGGGAGGYSGSGGGGGAGTDYYATSDGTAGAAGAANSGAAGGGASSKWYSSYTTGGGGGGGVGILGKGTTGDSTSTPNNLGPSASQGGFGGSGGSVGVTRYWTSNYTANFGAPGGAYGGGGGGAASQVGGTGGGGAVRIIWGDGRAFPSTSTGNV
jgi:hypothetical protein